jgi:hypothetical protein
MKKMSKKRGLALKPGANARVIESGSDGSFRAYRVPEKTLSAQLFDVLRSGYARLVDPTDRSNLRVGNTVRSVKKPFDLTK